ncbi:Nck-associated protein 5, partial [Stegodyphus mimosarum]
MLINELKKFKDMSPRSQEEQAKMLVEKLGEMERNNHQQQMQYETCLDEVANRLVQTLLVQKRLEEECKVLHLRVEQLEQENGTLMELIDEEKDDNVNEAKDEKELNLSTSNCKVQNKMPSHHPLTSSPVKKNSISQSPSVSSEEKKKESSKITAATSAKCSYSESKSPVTSPTSPGSKPGSASKIPSFNSAKPVLVRKKSKTDILSPKNKRDSHAKETSSCAVVPNAKHSSVMSSSKIKSPSSSEGLKVTSIKRKRPSRNGSPVDKGAKDTKQRMKSTHTRWEQRKVATEDLASFYKNIGNNPVVSPIQPFPRPQQIWSFNCELSNDLSIPESSKTISHSIDMLEDKLNGKFHVDNEITDEFNSKQNSSTSDASSAMEGVNRTRDEGYSTMSSDLQPDSAADTTVSEPEHSATYVITEKGHRSDDSVTECLDGSMCSSSDSGFGPLHQVAFSKLSTEFPVDEEEQGKEMTEPTCFQSSTRKLATLKHKEQIASVKPTIRNTPLPKEKVNMPSSNINETYKQYILSDVDLISKMKTHNDEQVFSPTKTVNVIQDLNSLSSPLKGKQKIEDLDYSSLLDYWKKPKDIIGFSNYRKTWHLGPTKSNFNDEIVFCTRHSYIDDNIFDDKIETAEKATLTEPEEELWREKALAPFIDESIWSLYSSESDIQVKHFPLEPLLSEPSLEKLISSCSPCIIVTEEIEESPQSEFSENFKSSFMKSSNNSSTADLNNLTSDSPEKFKVGLERVASDTVLYLKDAIHELEDSMHRGLKSSKNIPSLHQSGSESETSPVSGLVLKPELLKSLETAMLKQDHLAWPSPSRSSSTSSLQSSTSFHVISDETDDIDMNRTSRKGSEDPDLSSASDADYENLEHKDFVERWLQKEVVYNNVSKMMVPNLEPVQEIGEQLTQQPSSKTKTSLPIDPGVSQIPSQPRMRLMSYPTSSIPPKPKLRSNSSPNCSLQACSSTTSHTSIVDDEKQRVANSDQNCVDCVDDTEFQSLDSEAKEFNGDFYKLCTIGSLRSLDHFSPAKSQDIHLNKGTESPSCSKKSQSVLTSKNLLTKSDKSKPTGFVKPTRPVTLAVSAVPVVPDHAKKSDLTTARRSSDACEFSPVSSTKVTSKVPSSGSHESSSNNYAKINCYVKVPANNNIPVLQNSSDNAESNASSNPSNSEVIPNNSTPLTSLPASVTHLRERSKAAKIKSPTKIIIKSGNSPLQSPSRSEAISKRQQWKRDRIVARQNRLKEGCGTAWIHLQANPDLSDPKARSNLLDSLKAPTSSSGSSSTDEDNDDDEVLVIQTNSHLHRICRERRH